MATVGSLVVDIQANTARLQTDIKKMRKEMGGLQKSARGVKASFDKFERASFAIAKVGVAVVALKKVWDGAFAIARFTQAEEAFANLADSMGANSESVIASLRDMSAGTLSTAEIMKNAGTAMLLGIPAEKLSEMMEIARASARITGDSVEKAFQDIAKGMGRQSKLILDNLGIMVSASDANKVYAESLGKTVAELTDADKKQAFFNATMLSGRDIINSVGVESDTMAEKMQAAVATLKDFSTWLATSLLLVSTPTAGGGVFEKNNKEIEKLRGNLNALNALTGESTSREEEKLRIQEKIKELGAAIVADTRANIIAKNEEARLAEEAAERAKQLAEQEKARKELEKLEAPQFGGEGGDPLITKFENELMLIEEHMQKKLDLQIRAGEEAAALQATLDENDLLRAESTNRIKENLNKSILASSVGLGMALLAAAGVSGRKLFFAEKAIAVGRAIIAANVGAAQALAIGPAGIPIAAKIQTQGYINAATIAATAIGGGGGGGSGSISGGGASVSGGGGGGGDRTAPVIDEAVRGKQAITINIENGTGSAEYWQGLVDDVIGPAITDSQERNIDFTIQTT